MARQPTRLILSFIGNTDLRYQEPTGDDKSPILRLLLTIRDPKSDLQKNCNIPPDRTRLVLLDDRPDQEDRQRFCERLREQLPGVGLKGLELDRRCVTLPEGPTDLTALYEQVWNAIPTLEEDPNDAEKKIRKINLSADEVVFHVTSGTPAMQLTLVLASQSLSLEKARLFETSPKPPHVRELDLPYALALRNQRERERLAYPRPGSLSDLGKKDEETARKGLLKDTIIADPHVESAYAALYKAATNRKQPQRVLIGGSTGSGKWYACQQFARWRGGQDPVIWSDPTHCPEQPPEGVTLLIRWLDAWPESAWRTLALLADERRDLAIVATVRTDRLPTAGLDTLRRDGLRGAVSIDLPALGARTDVVDLAESLARQLGILDGMLKERLQLDLFKDRYPHNLHDLKALLATANAYSPVKHPERKAYLQARDLREAQRLLDEAWQVLAGMDFGPGRHRLANVLDVIRLAVVQRARAEGRSLEKAAVWLGDGGGSTVGTFLEKMSKSELDPLLWPSLRDSDHAD